MRPLSLVLGGFLWVASLAVAQAQPGVRITVADFLQAIEQHPDISAHAEGIESIKSEIDIARISPDPSLTFGNVSGDISGMNMPQQLYLGIDYTVETGRKRQHRVQLASAQVRLAEAEHTMFVNEFKRDALLLFQHCWMLEQQIQEDLKYKQEILSLNVPDSAARLKQQLLLLENQLLLDVAQEDLKESLDELNDMVKHAYGAQPVLPAMWVWSFEKYTSAQAIRYDRVQVSKASADVVHQEVLLMAANRVPDISISLGNNFVGRATNPDAASPRYNAITATVSVPLKFSNWHGAERKREELRKESARQQELQAVGVVEDQLDETQDDIADLSTTFAQLNKLIALQERFISQLPPTQSREKLEELTQLHGYRHQRWDIFNNISKRKADLFVLTGALPRDPSVLAGTKN
ncbi:TolC family protein [Parachryseolinea silvisoli]|uniref:TolC family protein n=1 Tax=Parachryseolinea silvisoli TaxID=2873601 RepID=UPI002265D6A0|nr:TolC family protein [Parachryseolinea silvisoli]MCD9017787.1 TolC family protein [Parachryseolinea silvisoli]